MTDYSPAILAALKRGEKVTRELLNMEGGYITHSYPAYPISIKTEDNLYASPSWQIHNGEILPGLVAIVKLLSKAKADNIAILGFFLEPNPALDSQLPRTKVPWLVSLRRIQ